MAVSIKDVARVAGVSYSTVSRALNDSPRVNNQTRDRIRRLAAELGYLPSAVGRSLVTRRTHTLGVVVSTLADLFFAEVIHAIQDTALGCGYGVVLTTSGGLPERELAAVRGLRERRVDGIVLLSGSTAGAHICAQSALDTPLVIINNVPHNYGLHSVEVDNVAGGRAATEHLLNLGHRRIGHIGGPVTEWDSDERRAGYLKALQACDQHDDPALVVRGDSRPTGAIAATQQLLSLADPPTALFCYNDASALGAMRAARSAGLRVPDDLSIVGFDDIDLAAYFEPPLTTVAQPKREMGKLSVQMLLDLLAGERDVPNCVLPSRLVIRESTARLGAGRTSRPTNGLD